jgi:hypothetical protein
MLGHSLCGGVMAYLFAYLVLVLGCASCGHDHLALCTCYREVAFCRSTIALGIGDYQSGNVLAIIFLNNSYVLQQI